MQLVFCLAASGTRAEICDAFQLLARRKRYCEVCQLQSLRACLLVRTVASKPSPATDVLAKRWRPTPIDKSWYATEVHSCAEASKA